MQYKYGLGNVCEPSAEWTAVQRNLKHPRIAVARMTILEQRGDNGKGEALYRVKLSTGRIIPMLAESHIGRVLAVAAR
jgi:hypothetical protein